MVRLHALHLVIQTENRCLLGPSGSIPRVSWWIEKCFGPGKKQAARPEENSQGGELARWGPWWC